jgi:RHS repeat-associated protein
MVNKDGVDSLYYTYSDIQGNLLAVTDAAGTRKQRYAYDPWGLRRNPIDWSKRDSRSKFIFARGYTLHEHLDDFGLINMNGRMYDPLMAQFLSPDPIIQAPGNWQNYNRYAYCMNNPLMYTDPSGYSWFGDHWKAIVTIGVAIAVSVATAGLLSPAIGVAIQAGSINAMVSSAAFCGLTGGFAGGVVGAALNGGNFSQCLGAGMFGAFNGAVMAGISAGVMGGIAAGLDNLFVTHWNSATGKGIGLELSPSVFGDKSILQNIQSLSLPNITEFIKAPATWPLVNQIPSLINNSNQIGNNTSKVGRRVVKFDVDKYGAGTIPEGCVYGSMKLLTGVSEYTWQEKLGSGVTTDNALKRLSGAGIKIEPLVYESYESVSNFQGNGGKLMMVLKSYQNSITGRTTGHAVAVKKIIFKRNGDVIFKANNPDPTGPNPISGNRGNLEKDYKGFGFIGFIWP